MEQKITFEDFVRVFEIVSNEFFNSTKISKLGMSGKDVDRKLDCFARKVYRQGKITRTEKDWFLNRHTLLGIDKSKGIPPRLWGKTVLSLYYSESSF